MYVDENVNVNMWWREEWIMIWISTDINYEIILQTYEVPMNDIDGELFRKHEHKGSNGTYPPPPPYLPIWKIIHSLNGWRKPL